MPRHARKEGFSRRHRFAQRGSFGPVLRTPRKIRGRLAVVHAVTGAGAVSRLGIALTRRLVPSSLERNRVKRMVRETFRRHEVKDAGLDCVVTLRSRFDPATAGELRAEVAALFDQLRKPDPR
jgi:ribonuclease P protein component